tara:strand:- start:309 stop:530 length:222 start_codon:yes stop_codon:yes gene_type:complete
MNVLEVKKNKDLTSIAQDLKFVIGEGVIVETLNLTLNKQNLDVQCYAVRTEQGDVIIPEISIIGYQKIDGTLH